MQESNPGSLFRHISDNWAIGSIYLRLSHGSQYPPILIHGEQSSHVREFGQSKQCEKQLFKIVTVNLPLYTQLQSRAGGSSKVFLGGVLGEQPSVSL
jgi:hypothetical protein